jgi:hypothetical protein
MLYKTMILELLQQRPQMHERLRQNRELLPALEMYATEMKTSHQAWQELLSELRPDSDPSQIASEAREIALKELEDRLPAASNEQEPLSLDDAMAYIRRPTPRE